MNEARNILYYLVFAVGNFWTWSSAFKLFVGIRRGMKIRSEEGATKIIGIVGGLVMITISSIAMISI